MTRMTRTLLIMAIVLSCDIAGSAMQKPEPPITTPTPLSIPVTVVSPLPVPVSGMVSGTVSAQESGIWNVGITGTPSVNIANTPTVNLGTVPATPLLFRSVDDPGRIPYQATETSSSCRSIGCSWSFPVISASHRLVIQHLSGYLIFTGTPQTNGGLVYLNATTGNPVTAFTLPLVSPGTVTSVPTLAFDQPVLIYVDGGSQAVVQIDFAPTLPINPLSSGSITATGYLLDCAAAPCASIAP